MNGDIYHAVFCLHVENLLDIVAVVDEVLIKTSDVWTVSYNNHSIKIHLDVVPIIQLYCTYMKGANAQILKR